MSPPFMPLHIGDYRRDTGHLKAAGHGAYLLLIMHYWATGGLPDDEEQLATIACMSNREWKRWGAILAQFFEPGWKHPRIVADLQKAEEAHQRRVEAGSKGGRPQNQCLSNAKARLKLPITHNQEKKEKEENIERAPRARRQKTTLPDGWLPKKPIQDPAMFDRFCNSARAHGRVYADWDAAWLNWQTSPFNQDKTNGTNRQAGGRPRTILEALDQFNERIEQQGELRPNSPRLLSNE